MKNIQSFLGKISGNINRAMKIIVEENFIPTGWERIARCWF